MRIFKNYLKIIYTHKFSIIFLLVIFTFLININASSNKDSLSTNYRINIIDNANNEESKELINFLDKKYSIDLKDVNDDEAKDLLFGAMTSFVLFIDEDNSLSYYSKEDSIAPVSIKMAIEEYLNTSRTLNTFNIDNSYKNTVDILTEDVDFEIINSTSRSSTEIYYTYLTYIIITIILSVIFLGYQSFLKDGVQNRIRISKTKLSRFNLSLYTSSFIFIILICILFVIIEYLKNSSDINKVLLLTANLILFAFPIIGIAYIISIFSKNINLNSSLNNIISLVLCFVSGAFVPQEYLPEFLLKISSLFPPYWYIKGIYAIENFDFPSMFKIFFIQLVMALVFIITNIIISRYKKGELDYTR